MRTSAATAEAAAGLRPASEKRNLKVALAHTGGLQTARKRARSIVGWTPRGEARQRGRWRRPLLCQRDAHSCRTLYHASVLLLRSLECECAGWQPHSTAHKLSRRRHTPLNVWCARCCTASRTRMRRTLYASICLAWALRQAQYAWDSGAHGGAHCGFDTSLRAEATC
jgi:hypothetical protein